MLQRIQSVYLFLVFVMIGLMIFFPLAEFESDHIQFYLNIFEFENADGVEGLPNPMIIGILTAILGIITIGTIFQFSNRKLQMKLNAVSLLINFGLLISIFLIVDKTAALGQVSDTPEYTYGSFFPMVSVLLIILANRSIRKDEALVKQSERLR
jgi:peptidoglycan/LPS O-acetylase OafA/YrhL